MLTANTAFRVPLLFFLGLALSAPPAAIASGSSLDSLLAKANVTAGEKVSHVCAMCHTFNKGEPNKTGPNLWGIVGSHRAHSDSFNYSDALKDMHNETWTYDALDQYLTNPHKFAPGDKMAFAGISNPAQRANLIAWLRTLSDHPMPLPGK